MSNKKSAAAVRAAKKTPEQLSHLLTIRQRARTMEDRSARGSKMACRGNSAGRSRSY